LPASRTDIVNRALQKLGAERITTIDDNNSRARAAKANYELLRDDLLREHPWNFAMTRTTMEALSDAPAFGFDLAFELPADCLRVVEVGEYPVSLDDYRQGSNAPFKVEGSQVLSNQAAPLTVRYVQRVTDESRFDPAFTEALATRLAAELAEELTQSGEKVQAAAQAYARAVRRAKTLNAIENPPEDVPDGSWIMGRL